MTEGSSAPVSASAPQNTSNAQSASPAKSAAKKKATGSKSKTAHVASHPKYAEMIKAALKSLNDRGGSSRAAILKYVVSNYTLDPVQANQHLKMALKNGVKSKCLKQTKGSGASGSFKLGESTGVKKSSSKKS